MLKKQESLDLELKTSIAINSTKSHTFNITFTPNTSTPILCWRELEMWTSTEDQEPSSRDSRYPTGLPLTRDTDGKWMPTQDKHGIMLWAISTVSGHLCNSPVREWNPTSLNGSDSSNGARVHHQDFSITKFPTQHGSDMVVTSTTQKTPYTHSLRLIKITNSCSVLIPPLLKEERNSRRNGKLHANSCQNSSLRRTWSTPMKLTEAFPKRHTSRESGNTTETTCSDLDLHTS